MYEVLTMISIIIGALVIIVTTIWGNKVPTEQSPLDVSRQDQRIEFDEINHKILELNEYAQFMKDEMEKKHKELLFLYQLIADKENTLREQIHDFKSVKEQNVVNQEVVTRTSTSVTMKSFNDYISSEGINNEKSHQSHRMKDVRNVEQSAPEHNRMVLQLFKEGYDVTEIAKKLDLGIGQVQLILKLYQ